MSDNKPPVSAKPGGGGWFGRLLEMSPVQSAWTKVVLIAVFFGVMLLVAPGLFGLESSSQPKGSTPVLAPSAPLSADELTRLEREYEATLEQRLSRIADAGQVSVTVSLRNGPTITPVTDVKKTGSRTTEKDNAGSSRVTDSTEENVTNVMTKDGGAGGLAVRTRSRPEFAGVLIVAEGARNQTVRARLFEAAKIALGISPELIDVEAAAGR